MQSFYGIFYGYFIPYFCSRWETCTSLRLIFPPFSALVSHRFKKFVLIVFLRNVCYALLKNKLD